MAYPRLPQKLVIACVAASLVLAAASGCSSSNNRTPSPSGGASLSAASSSGAPASSTTATSAATTEVNITLVDNKFEPGSLTVPVGKDVTIHLKNTGSAIHNMHILSKATEGKDFTSAQMINPGESSDFTVHFTKKGTVKFQCDFHAPDMAGTITVQ